MHLPKMDDTPLALKVLQQELSSLQPHKVNKSEFKIKNDAFAVFRLFGNRFQLEKRTYLFL